MQTTTFVVENIKCGGCMRSIKDGIFSLGNTQDVKIDQEASAVTVTFNAEKVQEADILNKLESMGYPLQGQNSLSNKAVSYVSCMIGRMK